MQISVHELSQLLRGELSGSLTTPLTGASGLEEATSADVSFLKDLKNQKASSFLNTKAGVVLVPKGIEKNGKVVIEVAHPLAAFAAVLAIIDKEKQVVVPGVHATAYVHSSAKIGKNISIGPFCVVEEKAEIHDGAILMAHVYVGHRSVVGSESRLYPHVVLREDVFVGKRCILHAGTILGSDGYGFFYDQGRHNKISQIGSVVVEDDVEIGSCTTIDRATTGKTIIRKGTKIDNLVQVAHNVVVGEHNLLAAQSGIAGSTTLGKGVVLGGQVGVADHIAIGDGTQAGAQTGINKDTESGSVLFGSPAQPLQDTLRQFLLIRRLPELFKEVKNLKDKLK